MKAGCLLAAALLLAGTVPAQAQEPEPPPRESRPLGAPQGTVHLTEVVQDTQLFEDSNLEVARLEAGTVQEIIVPVQVGETPGAVRRYKLSIRMHLEPVDG